MTLEQMVIFIDVTDDLRVSPGLATGYSEGCAECQGRAALRYCTRVTSDLYPQLEEHHEHHFDDWVTRIDFGALAGRIGQLTEEDNPQRKTVFTLLDKVRE